MALLANPQRQTQSGHQGNDFQHRRIEVRTIDQAAQVQAVEQPLKLIGHIAVVDVDRHGTDLAAGEKGLQILGAVVELDADVVSPSYATRAQRIAQLIGSLIELFEAELLPAAAKGNAIRHSLHHQLKNIRQIEGPCHLLSPSVFPFLRIHLSRRCCNARRRSVHIHRPLEPGADPCGFEGACSQIGKPHPTAPTLKKLPPWHFPRLSRRKHNLSGNSLHRLFPDRFKRSFSQSPSMHRA